MEAVIAAGTPNRFARLTLLDDPFSHRLRTETQREAIRLALAAGEAGARTAREGWGRTPQQIAAALSIPVIHSSAAARIGRSVLFSEYADRPPSITLYEQSIEETNHLIQAHRLADLLGVNDVAPIHLSHEVYHHLEGRSLIPGTKGFRVETHRLGPLRLRTTLPSLSEIAADRFATVLLSLQVPPKSLEFITLHRLNPDYAWQQASRLQEWPR